MKAKEFQEALGTISSSREYLEMVAKKKRRAAVFKKTVLVAVTFFAIVSASLSLVFAVRYYDQMSIHLCSGGYTPEVTDLSSTEPAQTPESGADISYH